ncbi:MAG TPA: TldD/PmbA family protein [Candidatus Binataceae bacterium]|nr:TldD/PmbA family protein [Candidatus Binataceae bacterium]
MAAREILDSVAFVKEAAPGELRRFVRSHRGAAYAEIRFEAVFHRSAAADDGKPRDSTESQTAAMGLAVHYGGRGGVIGRGQTGVEVGWLALSRTKLIAALRQGLEEALARARYDARHKFALLKELGAAAPSLTAAAAYEPSAANGTIEAIYQRDPRGLEPAELRDLCCEASKAVAGLGSEIVFNVVAAMSELRHELFANSAGAMIDQAFAFAQGDCYVVAQTARGHQESYDTIGQQRGFECLAEGYRSELMPNPNLQTFALELAREAQELAAAPPLQSADREAVVVTDPHFNGLVSHEIVGHPCEADRALKMEAAYAGRSWLLRSIADNEIGQRIGSELLSACSDPSLDGYGHYRYDHEGTEGRRMQHIEQGIFRGFLNSRATAAALGVEPNGSARASEAWHAPLIRMSNTFFMPGASDPQKIIGEVEHGYYVCGNLIPSIAESRENFRISARKVYEIDHGQLGQLYRSGSVIADSKSFFMHVDAVGNDLRLLAIPNCGKGQPMQTKRMSNGGPTLRSRARLGGGQA